MGSPVVPNIYELTPSEAVSGAQQQIYQRTVTFSTTASIISQSMEAGPSFPKDKCALITNICVLLEAGATQVAERARISLIPPGASNIYIDIAQGGTFEPADARYCSLNWSGSVLAPPESKILYWGYFDTNVNPNRLYGSICATLIPRGNIQLR